MPRPLAECRGLISPPGDRCRLHMPPCRYLMGEEGYCLTSLQSALRYVELLPPGALGR